MNGCETVAILGATSHIAKNLVRLFLAQGDVRLVLFAREPACAAAFAGMHAPAGTEFATPPLSGFAGGEYDLIVNCIGFGEPRRLQASGGSLFTVTEQYDNLVLQYLAGHPDCIYVNMSSGAVYRGAFGAPVEDDTPAVFRVNEPHPADSYAVAKLHSEIKHRAAVGCNIFDLRIFSFYSRHIDPDAGFFLSDIVASISGGLPFVTGDNEIVRDYVHPEDLYALVRACACRRGLNCAVDVYSRAPVAKSELLEYFRRIWNLDVRMRKDSGTGGPSGNKDIYCSASRRAARLVGYDPKHTSLEAVAAETRALFGR